MDMIKRFLLLLCLFLSMNVLAQNAQERIGMLIGQGKWFELERQMKTLPKDSLPPLMWKMAKAMTHHYFNRPDSACVAFADMLEHHQQELADYVLGMATLMGMDLSRTGNYSAAAGMMQDLYNQLTALGADSSQTAPYRQLAIQYRAYAGCSNICRRLHQEGEYRIPMILPKENEQHFIEMRGSVNDSTCNLIFDTGAGVNAISYTLASQYGLRMLDAYVPMSGFGMSQGRIAIADTLRIGQMAWENVPFWVVDFKTGHALADSSSKALPPVIGLPIMLQMQEMQLDFAGGEIIVPALPSENPLGESNLLRTDGENLRIATTGADGKRQLFHFDTGGYYTIMSPAWYGSNKDMIHNCAKPDSLRMAGVGGVSITRSYLLPEMEFRIGSGTAVLDSVIVNTGIGLHTEEPVKTEFLDGDEDGTVGLGLLEKFSKVTINLKDMYMEALGYEQQK